MEFKLIGDMPFAEIEEQMQQIPGFRSRKCGISISRLELKERRKRDLDGQTVGQGEDGRPPGCVGSCGGSEGDEGYFMFLLGKFAGEVDFIPFTDRVLEIKSNYRNEQHRERFWNQWLFMEKAPDGDAVCAALYLLTADHTLWRMAVQAVQSDGIDFESICIRGVGLEGYVLFRTAKDLYRGMNRVTLSELTDRELINDEIFGLVITAFLIRRYGVGVLSAEKGIG